MESVLTDNRPDTFTIISFYCYYCDKKKTVEKNGKVHKSRCFQRHRVHWVGRVVNEVLQFPYFLLISRNGQTSILLSANFDEPFVPFGYALCHGKLSHIYYMLHILFVSSKKASIHRSNALTQTNVSCVCVCSGVCLSVCAGVAIPFVLDFSEAA